MPLLQNNPCIKLLIIVTTSILIAKFGPDNNLIYYIILSLFLLLILEFIIKKREDKETTQSKLLILILFSISYININFIKGNKHPTITTPIKFTGKITDIPQEKKHSYKAILNIINTKDESLKNQKVIAYFEKNDKFRNLEPGDYIIGTSYFRKIKNIKDPYGFNYRAFLENKGIHYNTYISSKTTYTQKKEARFSLLKIRKHLINQLKQNINNNTVFQIVSALTLGYRDELKPETRNYFTSGGVMHVLAVSGLHVGMMLLFLNSILSSLNKIRFGKYIKSLLIIIGIWTYAYLTGFSPSVQRASFMFTFIITGKNIRRHLSIYNSIAASAFFLLIFHPGFLFNIGFQLSYMAVISIIFFYPLFRKILSSKNKLIKWGQDLLCISIAAQIGTLPISIYYFHQFPTYFWISNFIVIPAAYIILGATLLFFIFSSITAISSYFTIIITYVTKATVYTLIQIEKLPFALIEGLYISTLQLILILSLFLFIMLYIKKRHPSFFIICLLLICLIETDEFIQKSKIINQKKVLVYSPERHIVQLINGRKNYIITDLETKPDKNIYKNGNAALKLDPPVILNINTNKDFYTYDLQKKGKYIQFTDHLFFIGDGEFPYNLQIKKNNNFINMETGIYDLKK